MPDFYADSAGAQGTGDGSSAANACTLADFLNNTGALYTPVTSNSNCYVKNGTTITWTGAAGTQFTPTVGATASAPIRVVGYASTIDDGGIVELADTQAGGASADNFISLASSSAFWLFENLRVTGAASFCINFARGCSFRNCHAVNSYSTPFVSGSNTSDGSSFLGCSVVGTNQAGSFGFDFASARNAKLIDCLVMGAASDGFRSGVLYGMVYIRCVAHNNGGRGWYLRDGDTLINCVANGNSDDGFETVTSRGITVFKGCVASNNGAYGLHAASAKIIYAEGCAFNPANNTNTSGKSNLTAGTDFFELDEITADPLFIDALPATDTDLNLDTNIGSSLIAALSQGLAYGQHNLTSVRADAGVSQRGPQTLAVMT